MDLELIVEGAAFILYGILAGEGIGAFCDGHEQ